MEKLESLKLTNKMEIDTSMAKEYIAKITGSSFYWPSNDYYYETDPLKNIQKGRDLYELYPLKHTKPTLQKKDIEDRLYNLAKKIEENTEMFVQLEYLARGTDPRDVRDGHVKLMSQLVRCSSALWNGSSSTLYFNKSTHLYNLAFVVGSIGFSKYSTIIIIDDEKLRPLCRFFADLCRDVGLGDIVLMYTTPVNAERLITFSNTTTNIKVYNAPANIGCTGVVAERADLDSAIDCFINSSVTAPWRLKYIYVQESIFDDFKDALKARCRAIDINDVTIADKTFLIEKQHGQGIPTNAFRTSKELISLIETPYLSLWAAETALSHEIALRVSSSTIWINDYGSFFGPPRSAISVFNISTDASGHHDLKELQTLQSKWMKLQIEERFDRIVSALTETEYSYLLSDLKRDFEDSLLEITDSTICFGVQQHLGLINCHIDALDKPKWLRVLQLLLKGNAIFCNTISHDTLIKLQKCGVPLACYDNVNDDPFKLPPVNDEHPFVRLQAPLILERLKVVRTNYGTIFAN